MIAIRVTVPIACWRSGLARELLETERIPPPATCYGALLSLVGETDRFRHVGCRVSAGVVHSGGKSTVLRTVWRIQKAGRAQVPDFQELLVQNELLIWCDSSGETARPTLEERVLRALREPGSVSRFGGWSLGESTHLINDAWVLEDGTPPAQCDAFVLDSEGDLTLPVWVDHVGTIATRYAVGRLKQVATAPPPQVLPRIDPS